MIHLTVMESSLKPKSFLRFVSKFEAFTPAKEVLKYSRAEVHTGISHSGSNETRVIYSLPDLIY